MNNIFKKITVELLRNQYWVRSQGKRQARFAVYCQIALMVIPLNIAIAQEDLLNRTHPTASPSSVSTGVARTKPPFFTPLPPHIQAKAYILVDAYSGKVLASYQADVRLAPASLTKMMTAYLVSSALQSGRIRLDDPVFVSKKAGTTGGSRMFVEPRTQVSVQNLLQGIIVQSGNDASIAIAEHLAGTEQYFTDIMNQQLKYLGMMATHFANANGLPHPEHYTTARDMAILARAVIMDFPEDYHWYSKKSFTYNGIKQLNRNRLLWLNPEVDGIKTGDTTEAGFCLVATAVRQGMRLISVIMGASSDTARIQGGQALLDYGFRFFETHKIQAANVAIATPRVWFGMHKTVPVGVESDLYLTLLRGKNPHFKLASVFKESIKTPLLKGETVGQLTVSLNEKQLVSVPIVTLESVKKGGVLRHIWDRCILLLHYIKFFKLS